MGFCEISGSASLGETENAFRRVPSVSGLQVRLIFRAPRADNLCDSLNIFSKLQSDTEKFQMDRLGACTLYPQFCRRWRSSLWSFVFFLIAVPTPQRATTNSCRHGTCRKHFCQEHRLTAHSSASCVRAEKGSSRLVHRVLASSGMSRRLRYKFPLETLNPDKVIQCRSSSKKWAVDINRR